MNSIGFISSSLKELFFQVRVLKKNRVFLKFDFKFEFAGMVGNTVFKIKPSSTGIQNYCRTRDPKL